MPTFVAKMNFSAQLCVIQGLVFCNNRKQKDENEIPDKGEDLLCQYNQLNR